MSKRNAAGLAAILVWGANKLLIIAGYKGWVPMGAHLPPSYVWAITVLLMSAAAYLTTAPMTLKSKVWQWALSALAIIGGLGVQAFDVKVPVDETPTAVVAPAPVATIETPSPIVLPVAPENAPESTPGALEVKTAPQAEVLTMETLNIPAQVPVPFVAPTEVVVPVVDVQKMALLPLCLIPLFASRRARRMLIVAGLSIAFLVGCCGAQNKADDVWYRDTTCFEYTQLTAGSKSDPYGDKYQQEQLDRRVALLKEHLTRKAITCEGVTY